MNFKQQMQESGLEAESYSKGHAAGKHAALTSDLVKGLVEALELIRNDAENDWVMCSRRGDKEGMTNARHIKSLAETALTNYKQEINHLNEK